MIDIFKGLIDLLTNTIRQLFYIKIPIYQDHSVYLGMIVLTIVFLAISIILICEVTGLKFFDRGDDE